jgi:hypothetical protein
MLFNETDNTGQTIKESKYRYVANDLMECDDM